MLTSLNNWMKEKTAEMETYNAGHEDRLKVIKLKNKLELKKLKKKLKKKSEKLEKKLAELKNI